MSPMSPKDSFVSPFECHPEVARKAIAIWREQQRGFPRFVQRWLPDDLDMATGAWLRVLIRAQREFDEEQRQLDFNL